MKVAHKNKYTAEIMYGDGVRLAASNNHPEAVAAFGRAIDFNSGHAKAYFQRGVCYYRLGRFQRAIEDINAAGVLGFETAQFWSNQATPPKNDP